MKEFLERKKPEANRRSLIMAHGNGLLLYLTKKKSHGGYNYADFTMKFPTAAFIQWQLTLYGFKQKFQKCETSSYSEVYRKQHI